MTTERQEKPEARRILVVDDDDMMLRLYRTLFTRRRTEFDAVFESSGEGALVRLSAGGYDAVVLDWDLPALSGLDILKAIRADPASHRLKVIIVSGRLVPEDRESALDAGADEFLGKPFDPGALFDWLRAATKR